MSKVFVVGSGPGRHEEMTIHADQVLSCCDVIIGYPVYTDLVREYYPKAEILTTPMTKETERCKIALEEASKGRQVAIVCSGDSGIYGMAALVFELRGDRTKPEIEIVPGITAACSGAALLGAPLTHDFAVISLCDRLTEWKTIKKRLLYAAEADLSIVLYNPSSKGRPEHLHQACDVLLSILPENRICGICRNIGREDESVRILTLKELCTAETDMFCTVFIGNGSTRVLGEKMITPRGYRNG